MRWLLPLVCCLSLYSYAQESSQSGDLNTYKVDSDSNNTTSNVSTVYQGAGSASDRLPVSTSTAPSMMSGGQDSCLKSTSGGLSTIAVGISSGSYVQDEECNRRKDSAALIAAGMKIAGISRLCQNPDTFLAMVISGSPCPVLHKGKTVVGRNAMIIMKKLPEVYIPNYLDKKSYYDKIFGIGENGESGELETEDAGGSVSDRFRKVKW